MALDDYNFPVPSILAAPRQSIRAVSGGRGKKRQGRTHGQPCRRYPRPRFGNAGRPRSVNSISRAVRQSTAVRR